MFGLFAAGAGKEQSATKETSRSLMFGDHMFWALNRNPPDRFYIC
jgi:hypothetical protein